MKTLSIIRRKSGFTLIEVMVATGLSAMFAVMAISAFVAVARTATTSKVSSDIHGESRKSMDLMTKELRQAEKIIGCYNDDSYPYIYFTLTNSTGYHEIWYQVQHYYDPDTYIEDGKVIRKGDYNTTDSTWTGTDVARGVTHLECELFDASGNPITVPSAAVTNTKSMNIILTTSNVINGVTYIEELETKIMLRNM